MFYKPAFYRGVKTDGLAQCKYCGWYAVSCTTAHYHYQKFTHETYQVVCANPVCYQETGECATKEEAFEEWNNKMRTDENTNETAD